MFIKTHYVGEAMANTFSIKDLRLITRVSQFFTAVGSMGLALALFYMSPIAVNFSPKSAFIVFLSNVLLTIFFARLCSAASIALSLKLEAVIE